VSSFPLSSAVMRCGHAFLGLLAVLNIATIAACSSVDPAPWGGRGGFGGGARDGAHAGA